MAQNIIEVAFDLPKFDADIKILQEKLTAVYTNLKSQSENLIPIGAASWQELTKNMNAQNTVLEKNTKLQMDAAKQAAQVEKNNILAAKAAEANAKAVKAQEAAEQQRLKTQATQLDLTKKQTAADEKAAAVKKAATSYNPNNVPSVITPMGNEVVSPDVTAAFEAQRKAEADASMAAAEYGNSVNLSTEQVQASLPVMVEATAASKELEAAKLALAKANSVENETIQGYKVQTAAANKAAKEQAMITHEMLSPYQLLNKQYLEAQANAKDLAVQYGLESVEAKEAAAAALELNTKLQTIDKTVGLSQRNVGNYGSAFNRALGKATDLSAIGARAVQLLSRQIIQLGTGMLTFIIGAKALEAIGQFIAKMYDQWLASSSGAARAQMELKARIDELNQTVEKSASAFEDADANVAKLTTDVDLAKRGFINKNDVLKEYNDTMGKTTGELKNFDDLEAKIVSDGPDYIKLMFLKAEATSSFALASIAAMKAITAQADAEKNFGNIDFVATNKMGILKQALGIGNAGENLAQSGINAVNQAKKDAAYLKQQAEDSFTALTKQGKDFEEQAAALAHFRGWNLFDEKNKKGKKGSVTLESTKNALDLEFELYKIAQQRKIKLLDEEQNDTKKSFSDRVLLAEEYYNAERELAKKTADHEIAADNEKLAAMEANYKKLKKGTEKNNLAVEIENEKKQIKIVTAKYNDELIGMEADYQKMITQIVKDDTERRKKIYEDEKKSIENAHSELIEGIETKRNLEEASHNQLFNKKIIDQKKLDELEKKSIKENAIMRAQADVSRASGELGKALINPEFSTPDQIAKLKDDLALAQSKLVLAQNDKDDPYKNKKKKAAGTAEILEDVKSGTDLAASLVDIKYEKEINAIQKIIDLNNYRKDQELKNIQDSTLSNQEKAAQMILLDNTVAANNRKLEREKVAVQIKQAKFDRDAAILGILENAAIGYFKLVAQEGFVGIAEGIGLGIAAASQIALLMAKPLPQMPAYATGTDNHPGGPAIVGEGKFKELVSTPDGKSFLADKPMFFQNLPKGSRVTPLTKDMVMAGMHQSANLSMAERIVQSNSIQAEGNRVELAAIKDAVYETGRMTAQALRKQKGANVVVNMDTKFYAHITKVVKE